MIDLHIVDVDRISTDMVLVSLSDGRTFTYSLETLLTVTPDEVVTEEDAERVEN